MPERTRDVSLSPERRVTVTWVDTTNIATWQTQDEVEEFAQDGGWVCRNTGWVSYEDDECMVVSARRSGSGHWGLSERIPRQAIVELAEEFPRELLKEANEVLRSAHQIAHREQDAPNSTGWPTSGWRGRGALPPARGHVPEDGAGPVSNINQASDNGSMRRMGRKAGMTEAAIDSLIAARRDVPTDEQIAAAAEVIHRLTARCQMPQAHTATQSLHGTYYLDVARLPLESAIRADNSLIVNDQVKKGF